MKTDMIKLVGMPQEFYPQLEKIRTDYKVKEEFISTQAVQMQPQEQPGIKLLGQQPPAFEILMSGIIIIEKPIIEKPAAV